MPSTMTNRMEGSEPPLAASGARAEDSAFAGVATAQLKRRATAFRTAEEALWPRGFAIYIQHSVAGLIWKLVTGKYSRTVPARLGMLSSLK